MPASFLSVVISMYSEWSEHPDNLPEKYPNLNEGFDILLAMLKDKFEAMERRKEYISNGRKFANEDWLKERERLYDKENPE
jgi:hypothetical protein